MEATEDDKAMAAEVREACEALNLVLEKAADKGLRVELSVMSLGVVGREQAAMITASSIVRPRADIEV